MEEKLEEARKNAFTIESMPPDRRTERIGEITGEYFIYEFFQDNHGEYWFKTKYLNGEYTGTKKRRREQRRTKDHQRSWRSS